MRTPQEIAASIQTLEAMRENAKREIEAIATKHIPDYHWLDYRVSTFWTCDKSPIGMCVFKINDQGHVQDCRYCHQPTTRK